MARRVLKQIQLDRIAAVDRPCQEGAVVTILKRAPTPSNKDSLSLADRIAKDLIVLPMASSQDDDEGAMDYNEALEEVCECEAWCNAKEEIRPFVHALKNSLVSIFIDSKLDQATRALKIRDSVGQFLDNIQLKYAEAVPMIEQAVVGKRVRDLRKKVLIAKSGMAVLSTIIVSKSGPPAERKGAASEDQIEEAKPTKLHDQQVKKAWGGKGARRAGEARTRRGEHLGPHRPSIRSRGRAKAPRPHPPNFGPRRGKQSRPRDVKELRTGPRRLPGGERKRLLAHQHRQKRKHHPGKHHGRPLERRRLRKDTPSRTQDLIAKSAIVLAQYEDVADRVRKVIGNTAADYVHDFVHSSDKRFEGKSKQERIRQALGAYYSQKG